MADRTRIGAVSYLNTRPLVYGLERWGPAAGLELSFDVPSALSDRLADGRLDLALLPIVELARIPELEIVPGLGIVTRGPSRSVLLVTRRPLDEVRTVALDPHSRTSNALARLLFAELRETPPRFLDGPLELTAALAQADAAVRIGDKALFEPQPDGATAHDLASVWTEHTGLPFVFAVWAARPGLVDRELYKRLHASRREGSRALDEIAAGYRWRGRGYPEIAAAYLRENILFRLGAAEVRSMRRFFDACASHGIVARAPELRLAFQRWTTCHETAAAVADSTRTR